MQTIDEVSLALDMVMQRDVNIITKNLTGYFIKK